MGKIQMAMLVEIIGILLAVCLLPLVLLHDTVRDFFRDLEEIFRLGLLLPAIGAAGLACLTWANSTPDESKPWQSVIEAFSQGDLLGVPTPLFLGGLSLVLFVMSFRAFQWRRESVESPEAVPYVVQDISQLQTVNIEAEQAKHVADAAIRKASSGIN